MKKRFSSSDGMTLLELLVAMAITTIVGLAMVSTHMSQSRLSSAQHNIMEMQQNLRAAMAMMERDIRMAGYDPSDRAGAGFDVTFAGSSLLSNQIAFSIDDNENETIDSVAAEQIAYRHSNNRLEKYISGQWHAIAENIDIVNFIYLDNTGATTTEPTAVHSVQVSVIARTRGAVPSESGYVDRNTYRNMQQDVLMPAPNDSVRRIQLSSHVFCRNMGTW
jgi:type IV pilus assembly protein PilW